MAGLEDSTLDISTLQFQQPEETSNYLSQTNEEDNQQFATPEKVKGRKFLAPHSLEYLVAWKEFPGEDTWEPPEHLIHFQSLISEFEDSEKNKAQLQQIVTHSQGVERKREIKRNKKAKEYESRGYKLGKIIGLKRSRYDGQLLCKCHYVKENQIETDDGRLRVCFVDIQLVKDKEPDLLLDFYESQDALADYFQKK